MERNKMPSSPKFKPLFETANASPPEHILSLLWEINGSPDGKRRASIKEDEHPSIPGGYCGMASVPAICRWYDFDIKEKVLQIAVVGWGPTPSGRGFPTEELELAIKEQLKLNPKAKGITVSVIGEHPSNENDNMYFSTGENKWV